MVFEAAGGGGIHAMKKRSSSRKHCPYVIKTHVSLLDECQSNASFNSA
jgi:hypothetical protein